MELKERACEHCKKAAEAKIPWKGLKHKKLRARGFKRVSRRSEDSLEGIETQ